MDHWMETSLHAASVRPAGSQRQHSAYLIVRIQGLCQTTASRFGVSTWPERANEILESWTLITLPNHGFIRSSSSAPWTHADALAISFLPTVTGARKLGSNRLLDCLLQFSLS